MSLDALNIDLKCFSNVGYHVLGASDGLSVVKHSIREAIKSSAHIEITTLVVPGLSDNEDEFREECSWLSSLDCNVPLHITRYYPVSFERNSKPTDIDLMKKICHNCKRAPCSCSSWEYVDQYSLGARNSMPRRFFSLDFCALLSKTKRGKNKECDYETPQHQ